MPPKRAKGPAHQQITACSSVACPVRLPWPRAPDAALQTQPSHGTILFGSDGSFVYTPSAGFTGADQWTYKASDGAMTSGVTQVTINVAPLPTVSFLTSATTVNESSQSATIDIHL